MGPFTAVAAPVGGSQHQVNPHAYVQTKAIDYLHPEASVPMDAPMPVMHSKHLVAGIYYNILFPEERQNRCKLELKEFFASYLDGKTPEFLTPEQFETLNSYGLQGPPKGVLSERLAKLTLPQVLEGKKIDEALKAAQGTIQEKDIRQYKAILAKLQDLQAQAEKGSPTHERYRILIKAVDECVQSLDKALERTKGLFVKEFEAKGHDAGVALLKKWGTEPPPKLSAQEQTLEKPDLPIVFGGDLNAFEQSGAKDFIHELRQGPFEGGEDYHEGVWFFAHKSIVDATYLGRESDAFKAKIKDGVLERNALDHILTKNISVVAGTRSAVVYDAEGKLVDPYTSPDLYKERLEQRRTASDHLLNVAIFRT